MSGLQAWDGSGNLIVDIGDFSTRFVTRQNVYFPQNVQMVSFTVWGINGYNSFAAIKGWDVAGAGIASYACVTRENAVDIIYLPATNPLHASTMYVEVYQFV